MPAESLARESESAVWYPKAPGWDAVQDPAVPVCAGPPSLTSFWRRAFRVSFQHPISAARFMVGHGVRNWLSMALWLDSGRALGFQRVTDASGRELPVSSLLRRGRRSTGSGERERRITAALIVQNEESVLPRALSSIAGVVDEIVVVDGGSVDGTREVAEKYDARVEIRRFDGDFSAQRNFSLELVHTPWVLVIDADEVVPPALGMLLRRMTSLESADAVFVPRLTVVDDAHSEPMGWPDLAVRLFRPSVGRYQGRLHEQVVGCRRPIVTPISGPFLMHYTTRLRVLRNSLFYAELDPEPYSPEWLRWAASEVRTLEEGPDELGR